MDITRFRKKLQRYLKGAANETESAIVDAWYKSYQKDEQADIDATSIDTAKNAIRQKIDNAIKPINNVRRFPYYLAAASILLLSGAAFFYTYILNKQTVVADNYTMLQTKAGEVKQIVLPDSSVMWVNSLSRVRIPSSFNGKMRNVMLDEGEAFFEVKHNTAKPFRVNTAGLQVQVLGTSFNINAYNKLKHTRVAVATGKVAVSQGKKRLSFLTPGQELVFDNHAKIYSQHNVNIGESQSWKDGDTYLSQASFNELAVVVKSLYGLELTPATPAVSAYQFTLRLQRNVPATEALKVISLIHNTHFRKEGNEVVLY